MDTTEILITASSFLLGGVAAWVWRSRRDLPARMRVVEHFERRARLAERDQERAIRALNENELKVRKIEGTFEGLAARVAELEGDLARTQAESEGRGQSLEERTRALKSAEADLAALKPHAIRQAEVEAKLDKIPAIETELGTARAHQAELEVRLNRIPALEADIEQAIQRQADLEVKVAEKDTQIRDTEATLATIYGSKAWRALSVWRKVKYGLVLRAPRPLGRLRYLGSTKRKEPA